MKKSLLILAALSSIFLTNAQQRSCHTMDNLDRLEIEHPRGVQQMQKIENHTQKFANTFNAKAANGVINIPVVVHVVYNTSGQNISDAQVQSQIQVLNEDFRRLNSDKSNTPSTFAGVASDIEIEFCLASVDPNGNSTNGITRTQTSTSAFGTNDYMKYTSQGGKNAWPTSNYLNIWVCNMSGSTLGYAQFPGSGAAATDGVVISYKYFGRYGSAQAPFNKGRTATHEVGHWLNLRHIWGDGGCSYDDYVSDTPLAGSEHYGCPSWPQSSCSSTDMYMNYMDYVDDACMNLFTNGQKARMRALFAAGGFRESLLNSNGCGGGTPPTSGYCSTEGQDASYEWIANVTVGSLNNSTGENGGYADFTSQVMNAQQGQTYNVSLTPGFKSDPYNEYWKIWIDYNQDQDFDDAGELAFDVGSMSQSTVTGNITIPVSATTGQTRMRVSMKYNAAQTACETFQYGEVEDYTIDISAAPQPCDVPTGLTSSNITTNSAVVSWNNVSNAVNYTLQYKASSSSSWSNATSTTLSGLNSSTTYNWRVRTNCSSNNSDYSATQSFTTLEEVVIPEPTSYCASAGSNSSYEWIANVTVGSINNSTGNNGGYQDFTSISTDLEKGSSNSISLSPGFQSSAYNEYWKVWIDFNQDGDFNDAGELAFDAGSMSQSTVTGSLVVPSGALTGETRMRVSMKYNAAQTACETFQYGEVEDYTVNVIEIAAPPVTYCSSAGGNSSYEWIANVTVGSLNNSTGDNGGYEDFTSISTSLSAGNSYAVSLSPGFSGSTYNEYWKIWIDFNKDGDFTDANELVFDAGSLSNSTVTGSISIPNGVSGTTRMRVSMKYNGEQSSCESFQYGEVEDYTVVIGSSNARMMANETSIIKEKVTFENVNIYPNPTRNRLNIELDNQFEGQTKVQIIDLKGIVVKSEMMEEGINTKSVELNELPTGVYYLLMSEGETVLREKITVIK